MNALLGLLRKEVYHILRDRRTLVVIVVLPVLQVIIFGYAIRTDVDHVRLAIVDPAPDTVTLKWERKVGTRYKRIRQRTLRVTDGRFKATLRPKRPSLFRVTVKTPGARQRIYVRVR